MTIYKAILPTALLSIFCFNTAEAESPQTCEALNHVVEIVSIHQNLRHGKTINPDSTDLSNLKRTLMGASQTLDALINANEENLISENTVIKLYLTELHQAVSSTKTNHTADALYQPITPDLIPSLESFRAYWKCSPASDKALGGEAKPPTPIRHYGVKTKKTGQFVKGRKSPDFEKVQRQERQPNGKNLSRVAFGSVKLEQQVTLLLIILAAFVLILGTIIYQKRKQQFEIREKRTIVQSPLKVRMRNVEYLVHLADISMNGAKLKHSEIFTTNDRLHVKIGNGWHAGQIKWSNDSFAGVMFKTPLGAEMFNNIFNSLKSLTF